MYWIAISPKDIAKNSSEERRWMGTEEFRSKSRLKSVEYFAAVLRLDGETCHSVQTKSVPDQRISEKFFTLAIAAFPFVTTGFRLGTHFTT
jgi:hypothetical protein